MFAPLYYKKFKCIASACSHSCCVGWEIDIDRDTRELYESLPGALGDAVRESITKEEDGAHFTLLANGRCPHLREDGLCTLIVALGEGALCRICAEHPRFYNTVGDSLECGLGASCEEAARLILAEPCYGELEEITDELPLQPSRYDARGSRAALYALLGDGALPYGERRARIAARFAKNAALQAKELAALLHALEYLNEGNRALLEALPQDLVPEGETAILCERFLAYLVYRHASAAQSEGEFAVNVALALLLERLFAGLLMQKGVSPVQAAVTLSEEMEYSEENLDAIRAALEKLF